MRRILLILISLLSLTLLGVEAQAEPVQITIDSAQDIGEISPFVYGVNHGGTSVVTMSMQEEAAASGVSFFRFPGGHWGDVYNVTHPMIDMMMLQARAWGVTPCITVRLEGGTPEQAAELVHYANIEKDYNVRYWIIGNEPTLYDDYSIEQLNTEWRAIAEAMEAVDPTITLIGPEVHQFADSYDASYLDEMRTWVRGFLEVNGDMVDIVSVHRYPFPADMSGTLTTIDQMRLNVPRWNALVEILRADTQEILGHELPIAVTEVNSHWNSSGGGPATPDSHYNAIWWSGVLSTLIRNDAEIVTYWNFVSIQPAGEFGLLDRYEVRPTYYVYQLFKGFGTMQIASESSDDYVTVVAARREDGAVTVLITNLYEEARSVTLNASGMAVSEMAVLAPELLAETVDPASYFDGTVLEMPAQSAIRIVFTVDS